MPGHDVVVIGFSAGGVEALARLVAGLPAIFPLQSSSFIISPPKASARFRTSSDGQVPRRGSSHQPSKNRAGRIYVAKPDQHLLIRGTRIHLTRGPRRTATAPGSIHCFAPPRKVMDRAPSVWSCPVRSMMGPSDS